MLKDICLVSITGSKAGPFRNMTRFYSHLTQGSSGNPNAVIRASLVGIDVGHCSHIEPRDGRIVGGDLLAELWSRDGGRKTPAEDPMVVDNKLNVPPEKALKLAELLVEKCLVAV